jgi:hypothetical protein
MFAALRQRFLTAFLIRFGLEIRSRVPWVFWAVISLITATTGPFETHRIFNFAERALLWFGLTAAITVIILAIKVLLHSRLQGVDRRVASLLTAGLSVIVAGSPMLGLRDAALPEGVSERQMLGGMVVLIGSYALGLCAMQRNVGARDLQTGPASDAGEVRLLRRIDPDLRGTLLTISVRDHYVDVETSAGKSSILMRLSDAIVEADPVDGAQVHRSHWVAWAAVVGVERVGGKLFVRLKSGQSVPVGKNHREKLARRGLI